MHDDSGTLYLPNHSLVNVNLKLFPAEFPQVHAVAMRECALCPEAQSLVSKVVPDFYYSAKLSSTFIVLCIKNN